MYRLALVLVTLVTACSFQHGLVGGGSQDGGDDGGSADASTIPDASLCTAATIDCLDATVLRFCQGAGVMAVDKTCNWGCLTASAVNATPHCAELVPSADAVVPADAKGFTNLGDVNLTTGLIINGSTGEVGTSAMPGQLHGASVGVTNGIDYKTTTSGAAVFRFKKLTVSGDIKLIGSRPIVLIADDVISVGAIVDARGPCTNLGRTSGGGEAGPGGFRGGEQFVIGGGAGGGGPGRSGQADEGGGGGGNGGAGGRGGGPGGAIGPANNSTVAMLIGGSGGGGAGGGGGNSQSGGGGGGALQIISNKRIDISAGGINAGGCGGFSTTGPDGGAGGGAGGTILLEAPAVVVQGALAVNGGGGGAGQTAQMLQGENGRLDGQQSVGATSTGGGGGGLGGAGATLDGQAGAVAGGKAGGGGGAVGHIKFVTRGGTSVDIKSGAVLSPPLSSAATTQAAATTQ